MLPTPSKDARKPSGCTTYCSCEEPVLSVIDDAGLHDESATVVIIGGGPHALAALAALHEGSLAFQQYSDDSMFQARVGFNSHRKVGNVCIVDPGSHFMESWNARFASLEIDHLRSPTFAHPVAFEPTALLNFAIEAGRTKELIDAPFVDKWLVSSDLSEQESLMKALPSSALFRDFCASLEAKLPHRWLSGAATSLCKDASTGKYRVHYRATADQSERKVVARAVILATGPVGKWNVPTPFVPHMSSPLILHTEALVAKGNGTLSEEITRRSPGDSARVLVVGGGISAAQAALAAYKAGNKVVLRSRRPLRTRPFDIASEWLDVRTSERLRFEFLSLPMEKRRAAVRAATSGGSVPVSYMEELHRISQSSDDLRLEVDEDTDKSQASIAEDGSYVVVNGERFAMVILATGVVTATTCSPLYRSVEELLDAPVVDGLPRVDSFLRWAPEEDLFVLGANAMLELGPGGGNLMGAMRGARIVANELHDLMWEQSSKGKKAAPARSMFANAYASLLDDGNDIVGDDTSSSEEEEEEEDATQSSAAATANLSRPKAAKKAPLTKAEEALRKARRHRKATKPRRGMGGGRGR